MSQPQRVVLLASARTYRNQQFLDAARKLNLEVVQGKDVPLPMLGRFNAGLPLDYRDLKKSTGAIMRYVRQHPVSAIIGVDDSGTQLAASASAALGLPHNSPEATNAARNKAVMRQCFKAAGAPSPNFQLFSTRDDPTHLAPAIRYPCVIKPTQLAGSKGVMRADNPAEFVAGFGRLQKILATEACDEILVEDFIPGVEVALEGLLDGGELAVLALFDKPDPLDGPFFEETLYITPSRLPPETQQAVIRAAEQAAAAIGLREGPVHAELRVNEAGVWLVEVAARSIGGLCSKTLRFGTDMSLEELILRQAVRLPVESAVRENKAGGVMMIPIPAAGILRAVGGLDEALQVPLIESVEITAGINYPLVPLPEGDSYLGFIFARGERPAEVEAALREAHSRLVFEIAPELPVWVSDQSAQQA